MALVCLVFAGIGTLLIRASHAETLSTSKEAELGNLSGNVKSANDAMASAGASVLFGGTDGGANPINPLLNPYSMGLAPYAYVPYGDVSMADYATATGAKNFFAAFILGSGCTPLWDGDASMGSVSARSTAILTDITNVRAKGGDVAISFGGESGTELADVCTNVTQLQAAYQTVITKFSLKHINFDIESGAENNSAGLSRRVQAASALQQANPGLKVSLTIPVDTGGLSPAVLNVVKGFRDGGVTIASIDIMAMYFGAASGSESSRVISAAQTTVNQIKQLYSVPTADAYKALGIIVNIGNNGSASEVFTTADATVLKNFVIQNGVGTLSFWSANRDQPCGGSASEANDTCSGTSQTKYQFAQLMNVPAI